MMSKIAAFLAVAAVLGVAPVGEASEAFIHGAYVQLLPPPKCDTGVPLASISYGLVDTNAVGTILPPASPPYGTDPFGTFPGLAGVSPYTILQGAGQKPNNAYQVFYTAPQSVMSVLLGTPDTGNIVQLYDGSTPLMSVDGATLLRRLGLPYTKGGYLLQFTLPAGETYNVVVVDSQNISLEFSNLVFGPGPGTCLVPPS